MNTSQFCSDLNSFCYSNQIPEFVIIGARKKTLDWLFGLKDLSVGSVYAEWEHCPDKQIYVKASIWTEDIDAVSTLILPPSVRDMCNRATRRKLVLRYNYTFEGAYNKACTFFWK